MVPQPRNEDCKLSQRHVAIPGFEGNTGLSFSTSRRRFLQAGAAVAATGALAVAGEGMIFEANRPKLVSIEVPLPRLAESWDGFRIAQLSDLHYDDHFSSVPLGKRSIWSTGCSPTWWW